MRESTRLLRSIHALAAATRPLEFSSPVAYVYRPLDYAQAVVEAYVQRFGNGRKEVLFVGMNPGPFGMAQTGIPFGEVSAVRDWLKIQENVARPEREHPKRPVLGFDSPRSEVSGRRLWGAFAKTFADPDAFFARAFVLNYCPLLFLDSAGANLTPDKLRPPERRTLEAVCDLHLSQAVEIFGTNVVVGVGQYAAKRLREALNDRVQIATIPHPSPANPQANRGWHELAARALKEAGIHDFL